MREDHAVMPQQVIGMNFIAPHQLKPIDISGAQFQVAIVMLRSFDNQHRLLDFQRVERFLELFGLRFLEVERVDDGQFAVGKLRSQGRTQSAQKLFLGEGVIVRPRHRTVHRVAMPPQWGPDRSDTGAACALLLPQLLARAGNFPAALGFVRAGALPGAVVFHRFPEQVFVDRAEDLVGQIEGSDLFTAQIVYINRCHICLMWRGCLARAPNFLCLLRCSLCRLQRIDRSRTRESTTLSWRLLRLRDHDVTALRSRHAAFDDQQVFVFIDPEHPQIPSRYLLVAHVSRHPHAFKNAGRKCRRTDRTRNLEHRTVGLRAAREVMPLYDSLEPLALADSDDVNKLLAIEYFYEHAVANFHRTVTVRRRINFQRNFAQELHWRKVALRQVSTLGVREPRLLHKLNQPDLRRLVSILHSRLVLRDDARAGLQYCDGTNVALRVKQLRHPDLLAQNSRDSRCHIFHLRPAWLVIHDCYWLEALLRADSRQLKAYLCSFPNALISTSTPAGRSSFISASTVCCVGSRMSSSRLCVRISNCSRDFLSTCGERSTVYLFFIVGSGIGPAICAPVRRAVSTISPVDWSRMR